MVTVYKCRASTCSNYDPDSEGGCKCTLDEITVDESGSCDSYQMRCEVEDHEG
jgi:hypothetical protein